MSGDYEAIMARCRRENAAMDTGAPVVEQPTWMDIDKVWTMAWKRSLQPIEGGPRPDGILDQD